MGTAPHHDTEQASEVRRVHDDDHLVGRQLLLVDLNSFQLPLHPLCTATILLRNLGMGLFAVRELLPDLLLARG